MFLLPSKQKQTHNSYGDKNPISLWKVFCTHPYFDKEVKSNSKIWARVCILADEAHCLCWLVRPVIFQPLFKVTHTTKFIPDPRRWSASSQAQLFGFLPRRNSDLPSHHYTIMSMRSANLLDDLYNMASWLPLQCFGRARNGCEYFGLYTSPSPLFFYGRGNAVVSTVVRKVGEAQSYWAGWGRVLILSTVIWRRPLCGGAKEGTGDSNLSSARGAVVLWLLKTIYVSNLLCKINYAI